MPVRFGFVGTSYWGEEVHLPTLSDTDGIKLVGIFGRNGARVRQLAGKFGISAFDRYEDLLANVDAVAIAVAPAAQAALAVAAADAGKHLLLEKPVATTTQDAQLLAARIQRSSVSAIVFFMRRFVPAIEADIGTLSGRNWETCRVRILSGNLMPGSPYAASEWRRQDGIVLWDVGPHVFSILDPILGPVLRMSARIDGPVVRMTAWHSRGAVLEAMLSLHAAPEEIGSEYSFSGPDGFAELGKFAFTQATRRQAFACALSELLTNISLREMRHRCDAEFGVRNVRVLAAAQSSIEIGRTVEL